MFVERFGKHCESGLCTPNYHVLYYMVEIIRKFGTLSVLDNRSYEHMNVYI